MLEAMQLRREQLEEVAEARVALENALLPIRTKKEVRQPSMHMASHPQCCTPNTKRQLHRAVLPGCRRRRRQVSLCVGCMGRGEHLAALLRRC